MMSTADTRYAPRAWDVRPGDEVDPSVALGPEQVIAEIMAQAPMPLPAGIGPRLLGVVRTQPRIEDVLEIGPTTLMQDTPTRQDSGMQGTLRPATGAW